MDIIDTDDPEFGGFNRVDRTRIYLSAKKAEGAALNIPYYLYLYLPSRTALVLRMEPLKRATDI